MDDLEPDPRPEPLSREELESLCLHGLMASHHERIFFKDVQGRFLLVSAGFLAHLAAGQTLEEVIGKTDFDLFSEPHAAVALADEQRVMATGEPLIDKVELETFNDRDDVWVSTTKMALRDRRGEIVGTLGISRDITAQVGAEQLLEANRELMSASERQHRLLFELNPQPLVVYDRQTLEIVAVSNAMVDSYGYTREELLSMTILDLAPPEDAHGRRDHLRPSPTRGRARRPASRGYPAPPPQGRHDHRRRGHQRRPRCSTGAIAGSRSSDDVTERNRAARRARDRARRGGRGLEHEVGVPGQHEPRDPHADERRDRHDRAAARHRR